MCEKSALEIFLFNCFYIICKFVNLLDNNETILSRFGNKVSHKIDFTALGPHRDHPLVLELIKILISSIIKNVEGLYLYMLYKKNTYISRALKFTRCDKQKLFSKF